jgi:hypothetical protein
VTVTAEAIRVVDDALKRIAERGLVDAGMMPRPEVTVGPLDRDAEGPRLNWFLYRIAPNAAYRNMEPPATGSHTSRGAPPLALELHYLLTTYPADLTAVGDQEQTAHIALAAAMRAVHENAIVGAGSPFLPPTPPPLAEPLRFALESLDLETLSKIWTSASEPIRLSVGYVVSLVTVEQQRTSEPGPPVRERRLVTAPTRGARLAGATPSRIAAATPTVVTVDGLLPGAAFTLAPEPGDPAGAPDAGWPMTVTASTATTVTMRLPRNDLRAGVRRLDVTMSAEGLPVRGDSLALTVVPTILSASAPVAEGATVTLTTAHCGTDTELFVDGTRVAATVLSPTQVRFVVPAGTAGERTLTLRSQRVAGAAFPTTVTT